MEGSVGTSSNSSLLGWEYWLQWQVLVRALILILTATMAAIFLLQNRSIHPLKPAICGPHAGPTSILESFSSTVLSPLLLWLSCLSKLWPPLDYSSFFFYTQCTFALVMVYLTLATIVSGQGCRIDSRTQSGETDKYLKKDSDDVMYETITARENHVGGFTNLEVQHNQVAHQEQQSIRNIMYIIYQICAGAAMLTDAMLTDIVFWCLLLLTGCMHSVNAVFLISSSPLSIACSDSSIFLLWSCAYVVFQWVLHACCFTWWPCPFLELSTLYLGLGLAHVHCYGLYVLLVKAKHAALSRMFARTFVRSN